MARPGRWRYGDIPAAEYWAFRRVIELPASLLITMIQYSSNEGDLFPCAWGKILGFLLRFGLVDARSRDWAGAEKFFLVLL